MGQSIWMTLWQPLGNAAMNTRVFKEPRGFMRCVQWFFAIVAFGCCCDFSTHVVNTEVKSCTVDFTGNFNKANISIIVGFLNFFLWASNLWFLYKETSWFSGSGSQQPAQP